MARRGKKYIAIAKKKVTKKLKLEEAIAAVKKASYSKFTGTVEFHLALKLPKDKEAKSLKGSLSLPHSSGDKSVKIAVFANKDKAVEAEKAGADFTDMEKLMADVKAGKIEFDIAIATPDVMAKIASIGKQLGPKGLMPNPKTGTVTEDIAAVVAEYKKGKMNFACDESGVMHFGVGSLEMDDAKLAENIMSVLKAASDVVGKAPHQIVKSAHLAPTMGTSVEVEFTFED